MYRQWHRHSVLAVLVLSAQAIVPETAKTVHDKHVAHARAARRVHRVRVCRTKSLSMVRNAQMCRQEAGCLIRSLWETP